jgi:hypothetical protein
MLWQQYLLTNLFTNRANGATDFSITTMHHNSSRQPSLALTRTRTCRR